MLDPEQMLVVDVFLNEDGHAQERSLLSSILETVKAKQVWIADRNFCTRQFLLGIAQRESCFVIREHKSIPCQELSPFCLSFAPQLWLSTFSLPLKQH